MVIVGKNIKLLVNAPYSFVGDWTAFALCYSLTKYLPEAEVYLTKNNPTETRYFEWMTKLKVKHTCLTPDLVLPSTCLMVRPIDSSTIINNDNMDSLISEVKLDKFTPFVSYKDSCARFVMDDWINNDESPFLYADKLANGYMCYNELQVLKLWKQMRTLYPMLAKG